MTYDSIGLTEEGLITTEAREYNNLFKRNKVPKKVKDRIIRWRRTFLNRGYAANGRVRNLQEEAEIEANIRNLRRKIRENAEKIQLTKQQVDTSIKEFREKEKEVTLLKSEYEKLFKMHEDNSKLENEYLETFFDNKPDIELEKITEKGKH